MASLLVMDVLFFSKEKILEFSSRELFVIRKIVSLFDELKIERESDTMFSQKGLYEIQFIGIKESFNFCEIKEKTLKAKPQEKKAFLRGIYLGCGIISNPPSYHLEFRFEKVMS